MADSENVVRRVLPHDSGAERGIIGSMMMSPDAISQAAGTLLKEDFYNTQYGLLFEAMVQLNNKGREVDEITLGEQLRQMGAPEEISGLSYIGEILAEVQTSVFVKDYCRIVKDKADLRRLIRMTERLQAECYNAQDDVANILERGEEEIFQLAQGRGAEADFQPIRKTTIEVIGQIEKAARNKGKINGLPTGFTDLDQKLTGLHEGELILVAARPAMGKTAFVLNIAHHVATRENVPVAIFSLEMGKDQLVSRLMAMDAHVDAQSLKTGTLSEDEWKLVIESANRIAAAPIYINENSGITMAKMRSICRKWKQAYNIGLIVIDYLQLMSSAGRIESRQQFIADVSRALKGLARELKVPVIALSQLNRAVDSRPDHRPVLADLRESGAIEQDADVVAFIYRDDYYHKDSERPGVAEIIVAKQRNGSTGTVELFWIGKYTLFRNLAQEKKS